MRVNRLLQITVLSCVVVLFQQCDNVNFQSAQDGQETSRSIASINSAKFDCEFIGVEAMRSRLLNVLGIPKEDVPVLNSNGQPTNQNRIAVAATDLGEPNAATGQFEDLSCGMTKFKTSIEVFADACAYALAQPAIQNELFPQGLNNFDPLYLNLIGRLPTSYEEQQLSALAQALPSNKREAGVCAATAASLEALVRI